MNVKSTLLAALCLLMGALAFLACDFVVDRPALAQAVPAPAAGRYQITIAPRDGVSTVFVLDAHTGQCWYRNTYAEDKWTDIGSPVKR